MTRKGAQKVLPCAWPSCKHLPALRGCPTLLPAPPPCPVTPLPGTLPESRALSKTPPSKCTRAARPGESQRPRAHERGHWVTQSLPNQTTGGDRPEAEKAHSQPWPREPPGGQRDVASAQRENWQTDTSEGLEETGHSGSRIQQAQQRPSGPRAQAFLCGVHVAFSQRKNAVGREQLVSFLKSSPTLTWVALIFMESNFPNKKILNITPQNNVNKIGVRS